MQIGLKKNLTCFGYKNSKKLNNFVKIVLFFQHLKYSFFKEGPFFSFSPSNSNLNLNLKQENCQILEKVMNVTSNRFQKYKIRCCINAAVVERAKYEKPGK